MTVNTIDENNMFYLQLNIIEQFQDYRRNEETTLIKIPDCRRT